MKTVFDQTKLADTNDHPSIKRYKERTASAASQATASKLSAVQLREMCLELGVDDVGFVEIDRPSLADQKRTF